jgi:Flp pilus assembly protein CpaB
MKKNLVALLGVAFVVALLATALFYGLVVTKLDASVRQEQQASESASLGIPHGMRAVSVHVAGSAGVIRLLAPGHRVDVQAIHQPAGRADSQPALRTLVQNIEVFRVELEGDGDRGRAGQAVVTLLARPEEADLLALADSAMQLRLLLRDPSDHEVTVRESVPFDRILPATRAPNRAAPR